jgi:Rab-GTPase-TBC domain
VSFQQRVHFPTRRGPEGRCWFLQVGYCQGMAFVAGVLLMYLPEEPAFKGLCRLMDSPEKGGCGLRDLYMPGLEGLKRYLRMFEWLMGRLLPQVKEQLEVPAPFLPCRLHSCLHCPSPAFLP